MRRNYYLLLALLCLLAFELNSGVDVVSAQETPNRAEDKITACIERMVRFRDELDEEFDRVHLVRTTDYAKIAYFPIPYEFDELAVYDAIQDRKYPILLPYTNEQLTSDKVVWINNWAEDNSGFTMTVVDPVVRIFGAGELFICLFSASESAYVCNGYQPDDIDERVIFTEEDIKPQPSDVIWSSDSQFVAVIYSDFREIDVLDREANLLYQIPIESLKEEYDFKPFVEFLAWSSDADKLYLYGERDDNNDFEGCKIIEFTHPGDAELQTIYAANFYYCDNEFYQFTPIYSKHTMYLFRLTEGGYPRQSPVGLYEPHSYHSEMQFYFAVKSGMSYYRISDDHQWIGFSFNQMLMVYDVEADAFVSYDVGDYRLVDWFEAIQSFVLYDVDEDGEIDFKIIPVQDKWGILSR